MSSYVAKTRLMGKHGLKPGIKSVRNTILDNYLEMPHHQKNSKISTFNCYLMYKRLFIRHE